MIYKQKIMKVILFALLFATQVNCSKAEKSAEDTAVDKTAVVKNEIDFWLTKGDQLVLLQRQNSVLAFGTIANGYQNIEINSEQTYQAIDGFGYSLTGGSAEVINQLSNSKKKELLQELFGSGENDIAISYLRISVGASDLNTTSFSYDDIPKGETDLDLKQFSVAPDKKDIIPLLKEILAINPNIKIMATPWSPPVWMKTNGSFVGGELKPEYYNVYAQYIVKYLQQMKQEGITIDAITPQNEPLHGGNNPSLLMSSTQQANFIKNSLGPAFKAANLKTKIILYDHNCDKPEYPINVLKDKAAFPFIDGSAFHLYAGDISALTTVHDAFPTKNVYFTEQWTSSNGHFDGDLKWHLQNVIIGSMRNWSKNALEWNLANNPSFGPHTLGGCDACKGAITINSDDSFERNVSYYIIAHASKFVPDGSIRIGSDNVGDLTNVAFKTPSGKTVLIAVNIGQKSEIFNIKNDGKWITSSLDAGAVGTYVW